MVSKFINDKTYENARNILFPYILAKGGTISDAEDVLQEGFIFLCQKLLENDFNLSTKPERYIFGVCKKKWSDKQKKRKDISVAQVFDTLIEENNVNQDEYDRMDHYRMVYLKSKDKLSIKCQMVFQYREEGLSFEHIAKKMGWANSNIARKKIHLCKRRLLEKISEDTEFQKL